MDTLNIALQHIWAGCCFMKEAKWMVTTFINIREVSRSPWTLQCVSGNAVVRMNWIKGRNTGFDTELHFTHSSYIPWGGKYPGMKAEYEYIREEGENPNSDCWLTNVGRQYQLTFSFFTWQKQIHFLHSKSIAKIGKEIGGTGTIVLKQAENNHDSKLVSLTGNTLHEILLQIPRPFWEGSQKLAALFRIML